MYVALAEISYPVLAKMKNINSPQRLRMHGSMQRALIQDASISTSCAHSTLTFVTKLKKVMSRKEINPHIRYTADITRSLVKKALIRTMLMPNSDGVILNSDGKVFLSVDEIKRYGASSSGNRYPNMSEYAANGFTLLYKIFRQAAWERTRGLIPQLSSHERSRALEGELATLDQRFEDLQTGRAHIAETAQGTELRERARAGLVKEQDSDSSS